LVLLFKDNNKTLTDTKLINYGKFYKKLWNRARKVYDKTYFW
jgi:hypothetical protein